MVGGAGARRGFSSLVGATIGGAGTRSRAGAGVVRASSSLVSSRSVVSSIIEGSIVCDDVAAGISGGAGRGGGGGGGLTTGIGTGGVTARATGAGTGGV